MGPFLDINHQDISSGEIFFEAANKERVYISHEELFQDLVTKIAKEIGSVRTKVIMVPSHKDIHHIDPLPQNPFSSEYFKAYPNFILAPNPAMIQLNDIKVGIINTDVLKDLCPSFNPKNMDIPKIDLVLKGILEQKSFYPFYPPQFETPIEYDQIDRLMISQTPDILITPSDLLQFVKVRFVIG
jgi:DNA polymerase II small subunit/DNA polymerase delta subunit B